MRKLPISAVPHFYPRPPRGGRLGLVNVDAHEVIISIHALREEGDHPHRVDPILFM